MSKKSLDQLFTATGDEITSPLAEHLAALVMKARAHTVGLYDCDGPDELADPDQYRSYAGHLHGLLHSLEELTSCLDPHLFKADALQAMMAFPPTVK